MNNGCRPFKDHEVKTLLNSFSGRFARRDRALFMLGVKTGFRISEMLSLRIRDVFKDGKIVDRITVTKSKMKGKSRSRSIVLHSDAKNAIFDWLLECGFDKLSTDDYLFRSRKGNGAISRVQAYQIIKKVAQKNGLTGKIGCHSMRKVFADKIYEKLGRDLIRTQKALGHKWITSTTAYLSFKEEEIEEAILSC